MIQGNPCRYKKVVENYAIMNKVVFEIKNDFMYKDGELFVDGDILLETGDEDSPVFRRYSKDNLWFLTWTKLRIIDETGFDFYKLLRP